MCTYSITPFAKELCDTPLVILTLKFLDLTFSYNNLHPVDMLTPYLTVHPCSCMRTWLPFSTDEENARVQDLQHPPRLSFRSGHPSEQHATETLSIHIPASLEHFSHSFSDLGGGVCCSIHPLQTLWALTFGLHSYHSTFNLTVALQRAYNAFN